MIKWKQQGGGFEDYGLDFGEMDFIKLSESFGAHGYKVSKKEDFKPLLEEVIQKPGIQIIDLDFDYPTDGKIC